jgi:acyl-CoA thioester hydrolase
MKTNRILYRVIYADTDQMGVVYHAQYLRMFEMGRTEYLRASGLRYRDLEKTGLFSPIVEAYLKYRAPARYDDMLVIETSCDTKSRASLRFDYRILCQETGKLLVTGYTRHAFLDKNGKVVRPPRLKTTAS